LTDADSFPIELAEKKEKKHTTAASKNDEIDVSKLSKLGNFKNKYN
jgi:hypothetical protein